MKLSTYICVFAALLVQASAFAQAADPVVRQLPAGTYDSVKLLLKKSWAPALKDTIIIHYQQELPVDIVQINDELIQQNITEELRFLHSNLMWRKKIDIFQFAADGPNNNKMKEFNNLLTIDAGDRLHQLLFDNQHPSGSVMLLPGSKCVYFAGNEKWEALKVSTQVIQKAVQNDLAKLN